MVHASGEQERPVEVCIRFRNCIEGFALATCKQAWARAMNYCDYAALDQRSKRTCADWKKTPEHFIVNNVLRAKVNPIDGGKTCVPGCSIG